MATSGIDVKDASWDKEQRTENLAEKQSTSSGELEAQHVELDEAEANRVLRKVDYRLVPILALLYLVAFIDRSNSMSLSFSPRATMSLLTCCSWKRQYRWTVERLEHARSAIQHGGHAVLRTIHTARSAVEHYLEDDEAKPLDVDPDACVGYRYDIDGVGEQLWRLTRRPVLLGRD
jgi:hypothetical protein